MIIWHINGIIKLDKPAFTAGFFASSVNHHSNLYQVILHPLFKNVREKETLDAGTTLLG